MAFLHNNTCLSPCSLSLIAAMSSANRLLLYSHQHLSNRGGGSNLKMGGGHMASAEREPIRGSGAELPAGSLQEQSSWSGGLLRPPEAERFLGIIHRKDRQYLPLYPTFESADISTKHCLESK